MLKYYNDKSLVMPTEFIMEINTVVVRDCNPEVILIHLVELANQFVMVCIFYKYYLYDQLLFNTSTVKTFW